MNTTEQKLAREFITELRIIAQSSKELAVGIEAIRVELKKKRYDNSRWRATQLKFGVAGR